MSLLRWDAPIDALCRRLETGPIDIALGQCTLQIPGSTDTPRATLACMASVRVGGDGGFQVRVQGAVPDALRVRMTTIAFGFDMPGTYRLRGVDAEGATWFVRNNVLSRLVVDELAGYFEALLEPQWITVRAPPQTNGAGGAPQVELVVDPVLRLPAVDFNVAVGIAAARHTPGVDEGRLESQDYDIVHQATVAYRVISMVLHARVRVARQVQDLADAIAFINGRRAGPLLTRVSTRRGRTLHVHRPMPDANSSLPPLPSQHRDVWLTFEAYLRFVRHESTGRRATLGRYLAELHGALGTTYISASALVAVIAVEGLVNHYIAAEGQIDDVEATRAKAVIAAADLPPEVKAACTQRIGDMKRPTANSRLRALRDRGIVDADAAACWIAHRPKLAHANRRESRDDLDAYLAAVTLFHSIVLALIGVETRYQNRVAGGAPNPRSQPLPDDLRRTP